MRIVEIPLYEGWNLENEKVKKAVKEKITDVLKGGLPKTPQSLAKAYLHSIIKKKPFDLPGKKIFNPHIHSIEQPNEVFILVDKRFKSTVKEAFKKLSQKTRQQLRDNYDDVTISHILEAIVNFEYAILNERQSRDFLRTINALSRDLKKRCSNSIEAIDSLLKNAFLTESGKSIFQEMKKGYQTILEGFKQIKTNPANMTNLYRGLSACSRGAKYAYEPRQWLNEYITECCKVTLLQEQGRPQKIFFNTLLIVIYKWLTEFEKPKKRTRYVEWAKALTADIVNESYKNKGLQEITAKDVDNALSSA